MEEEGVQGFGWTAGVGVLGCLGEGGGLEGFGSGVVGVRVVLQQ